MVADGAGVPVHDGDGDARRVRCCVVTSGVSAVAVDPWVAGVPAATTAVYRVQLNAAPSCKAVTPVGPTVTEALCRGGVLQAPTLELAETDGITYSADREGPYADVAERDGDGDAR